MQEDDRIRAALAHSLRGRNVPWAAIVGGLGYASAANAIRSVKRLTALNNLEPVVRTYTPRRKK